MALTNTYVLTEKSIDDILISLKEFVTTMTAFSKHNNSYKYEIKIIKAFVNWNATITVTNEKQITTGKA